MRNQIHIGYPAAIAAAHSVLIAAGVQDSLRTWELAAQSISLLSSLATLGALWCFTIMVFPSRAGPATCRWPVAWVTVLLFGVGRKWAVLGADVLTDAPAVCMQMWTVVLAVFVVQRLRRAADKRALLAAAGAGVTAALGYLVRPEALMVAPLTVLLWVAHIAVARKGWKLALACIVVMTTVTLACMSPYVLTIGSLTRRHPLVQAPASNLDDTHLAWMSAPLAAPMADSYPAVRMFANQLFEAMHPALGFISFIWFITWISRRVFRAKLPEQILMFPRAEGGFWMVALPAVFVPLLFRHYARHGTMVYRYVTFMAILLTPLAGAGMVIAIEWIKLFAAKARVSARLSRLVLPVVVLTVAAFLARHALRPIHENRIHNRRAGEYIRSIATYPDDFVLAGDAMVLYYSQAKGGIMQKGTWQNEQMVQAWTRQYGATYMAISNRDILRLNRALPDLLREPFYTRLKSFSNTTRGMTQVVHVYRIDREALGGGYADRLKRYGLAPIPRSSADEGGDGSINRGK